MTIEEILKAQGIEDEQVGKIVAAMKDGKVYTASEENLDVRYSKLKDEHAARGAELDKANSLIKELQKANKGNDALQGQVAEYEVEVARLKAELAQTQLDAALKVALLAEKAVDVDYLAFKLREGEPLQLDEQGQIKGWADRIGGLKTQFPNMFEAGAQKRIDENKLGQGDKGEGGMTRSDILKMPYAERTALFEKNPEAYREAMGK